MKIKKTILSLLALSLMAMTASGVLAQNQSNTAYQGKQLPVESLLGLLDEHYHCVSYTRVALKLPPPEAQNQHLNLGDFDLFGQELLAVVEMPPQLYEQFTGRLVNDCVSATGLIEDKSYQTTIAMFDKPLPKLTKLASAVNKDPDLTLDKNKRLLSWRKGSNDWYLTILGERLMVLSTSQQAINEATTNYQNNKVNQVALIKEYASRLSTIAPHAQIDGSKSDSAPLVLEMDTKHTLTMTMPGSSGIKPKIEDWTRAIKAFEQDTDVKFGAAATPFKLSLPGDSAAQIKAQKCLMVECSPAIVHHFRVAR